MSDLTMPKVVTTEARWETESARRYMAQLCKHFAHRCAVTLNEADGQIAFGTGICDLAAEAEALRMRVSSSDEAQLPVLQSVVTRHLQRFAFRDLTEEAAAAIPWARL